MNHKIQRISSALFFVVVVGFSALAAEAQNTCDANSIAGPWRGLSSEGNGLLISFMSGGTAIGNVQTEVTLNPRLSVLTPSHDAWAYLGNCHYALTGIGLLYSIQTGKYTGYLKAKTTYTFDPANPNVLTGTDHIFIYDAKGNLAFEVPEGATSFTRIIVEP